MLRRKSVQYNSPDGTGIGTDAGPGEWTGEKRRKPLGPSLLSDVLTGTSDSPAAKGDQEDPFFTAANLKDFTVDFEEVKRITTSMKERASIFVDRRCILDDDSQRDVYERLLIYRLKAHKLSKGEPIDNHETLKKELPDFLEKETERTFQLKFDADEYFQCLQKNQGGSVGWYFDLSKLKDLTDYQRLVLKNHADVEVEYLDWEGYRSNARTYKMDKEYVMFFTEMSGKLGWLKEYIGLKESYEWLEKEARGAHQALKIAERFPGMTVDLVFTAYREHIWSLHNDYWFREEWDAIFLEIWRLVTRTSLKFTPAVIQVMEKKVVARHELSILRFLKNRRLFDLESKFDSCVKGIPRTAKDGVAKKLIKKAILKLPKKKMLHQYIKRKMSIAKKIGLNDDK